jgi:hypothetical protein
VIPVEDAAAHRTGERDDLATVQHGAAQLERDVGRALHDGHYRRVGEAGRRNAHAVVAVDRGHPLPLGIKQNLMHAGQYLRKVILQVAALRRRHDHRALRGVADDVPGAAP